MANVPPAAVVQATEKLRSGMQGLRRKMVPPNLAALDFVNDLWGFQITYALLDLGVFDHVRAGSRTADEIAGKAGANPDYLYRLMRAGTVLDLLREQEGRAFSLTAVGEALCADHAGSFRDFILFMGRYGWQFWGRLSDAVRAGTTAIELQTGQEPFAYLTGEPEVMEAFNRAMTAISNVTIDALLGVYDFRKARRIVDVGGGHGRLLAGILGQAKDARGVLFDQPQVVEGGRAMLQRFGVADRCEIVGGSFFEEVPSSGDLYVMKAVLHDWQDPEALSILRNTRRAILPEGKVILVEMVVPGPGEKHTAKLLDIEMIVHGGGRERTREEHARLFAEAGFRLTRVLPTAGPVSVVEAVPVV